MQPIRRLEDILWKYSTSDSFLYTAEDLKVFFPDLSETALMKLLSRAVKCNILERVCKGIYLYPRVSFQASKVLYKVASKLRADCFNYISLESVLCAHSVISQQMLTWLTVMTSGRSNIIDCGRFGSIEFIHTEKKGSGLSGHLTADARSGMMIADLKLAMEDERDCKRKSMNLVDWNLYNVLAGEEEKSNGIHE